MSTPTLTVLALAAHIEAEDREAMVRRSRRRQDAHETAARLTRWTGLPVEPPPDDYPFKWQGYWFRPDGDADAVDGAVEMYAWDDEDGWDWWRCRSLAVIGERIAAWQSLDPAEQGLAANNGARRLGGECLPDSARALVVYEQES